MRKTKIICTIGPATSSAEMLEKMAIAGMNIARLNMSHGDHDSHRKLILRINALNLTLKDPVAILIDTQGPEIRTGFLDRERILSAGEMVSVVTRDRPDTDQDAIKVNYPNLIHDLAVGDTIAVDNGLITLEVVQKSREAMKCQVLDGGVLKSLCHVNLPGKHVNLPSITVKDREDIELAISHKVDFIALSFVRSVEDIEELRLILKEKDSRIKIIAKVENHEGLGNLESIIKAADALMVARGDLGIETPLEVLPRVQRRMIRQCAIHGRRVIVATHMLESMITNSVPTRAEVSDAANAVYEEADAIMLSAETAVGKHPVRCVEMLDRIARSIEKSRGLLFTEGLILDTDKQEVSSAAVKLAESIGARAIIVPTKTGRMANFISNCHPQTPVICAFTFDEQIRRQLNLNRNVLSFNIDYFSDPDDILCTASSILLAHDYFAVDDKVVVVSDTLSGRGIDTIQIRTLGDLNKLSQRSSLAIAPST
jgi:pyruvate kinase